VQAHERLFGTPDKRDAVLNPVLPVICLSIHDPQKGSRLGFLDGRTQAIAPEYATAQVCKRGQSARADRPGYGVAPCVLPSFGQCG
jgi:hypothetical protein